MTIRVGTAGWTDPGLIRSKLFYPKACSTAEQRLRYYASQFPMVEVDSSYYALPSSTNATLWTERTPEDFVFNVKAFRLLTGHQTPPKALPADIAKALAPHFAERRNVYYKDVPDELRDEIWRRFEAGVRPLQDAGRLSALHFQFPKWVTPAPDWQRHLEECVGRLPGYRLAFEFRNRTWFDGRHDERTLAMERDLGVAHVVVDEPQALPRRCRRSSACTGAITRRGRRRASRHPASASTTTIPTTSCANCVVFNNNRDDQGSATAAR